MKILKASCACLLLSSGLYSQSLWQPKPGAVFAANNGLERNEVVMYRRAGNGTLTQIGKYLTGGRGEGGTNDPLQSQNSLVLNADHSFLFAVNAGSSDISVFRVTQDRLELMSVVPSGGGNPVSVAVHDDLVYVVNFGGNYQLAGFRLLPWGELKPIRGSRRTLSALDTGAATVAFSPDGSKLVVTERISNKIDVFSVTADGTLATPVYNKSEGIEPFGFQFTENGTLLVTETNGGPPNEGTVSSYTINADNTLTTVSAKTSASGGATCWLATGRGYAWVSDTSSGNLGALKVEGNGVLTPLGSVAKQPPPASGMPPTSLPLDLALSEGNQYLYVTFSTLGRIGEYRVESTGGLTLIGFARGAGPGSSGVEGLAAF